MPKAAAEHDTQIAVRMPAALRVQLDKLARRERRKAGQIIRMAIEDYLERQGIK